jgi:hypothetical protein
MLAEIPEDRGICKVLHEWDPDSNNRKGKGDKRTLNLKQSKLQYLQTLANSQVVRMDARIAKDVSNYSVFTTSLLSVDLLLINFDVIAVHYDSYRRR